MRACISAFFNSLSGDGFGVMLVVAMAAGAGFSQCRALIINVSTAAMLGYTLAALFASDLDHD
jgi:hypothetical protein